jgi:3-deoxy-D-manno-octulosonate 8-phosphate phosphatase (KDO 8-P phosphatase)
VKPIPLRLRKKAEKIKLLLLDVDGVLTDGGIVIDNRGVETKRFDVHDGQGITLLVRSGLTVGFITSRRSKIVSRRARELGVKLVYQGVQHKGDAYDAILSKTGLTDEQIACVGDDLADLPLLCRVGFAVAVGDSVPEIKQRADYVTRARGGNGAVREICELILKAQHRWEKALDTCFKG